MCFPLLVKGERKDELGGAWKGLRLSTELIPFEPAASEGMLNWLWFSVVTYHVVGRCRRGRTMVVTLSPDIFAAG